MSLQTWYLLQLHLRNAKHETSSVGRLKCMPLFHKSKLIIYFTKRIVVHIIYRLFGSFITCLKYYLYSPKDKRLNHCRCMNKVKYQVQYIHGLFYKAIFKTPKKVKLIVSGILSLPLCTL